MSTPPRPTNPVPATGADSDSNGAANPPEASSGEMAVLLRGLDSDRSRELWSKIPPHLYFDLLHFFVDQVSEEIRQVNALVASSDIPAVREVSHRLRGSCSTVGAFKMAAVCHHFEALSGPEAINHLERFPILLVAEFELVQWDIEALTLNGLTDFL